MIEPSHAPSMERTELAGGLFVQPTRAVTGGWLGGFSAAWLGLWMASLTTSQYLMPEQLAALFVDSSWQETTLDFGLIAGISALVAVIAYPSVGALSDRTVSRFGRRRPWILGGTLVSTVSLLVLAPQTTLPGVGLFWGLFTAGFCATASGLTSLIADQVPVRQRGLASALISAPQAVGVILGVLLATAFFASARDGYFGIAILQIVLIAPFVVLLSDPSLPRELRPPFTARSFLTGFWINPLRYPDFGWTLLSRTLANLANALCTGLLLYYLLFGLQRDTAAADLLVLTVVYAVTSVLSSVVCGRLSDRIGRRRMFVVVSAALQAAGAVPMVALPSFPVVVVSAIMLGLGWGCYTSVDQALATEVLPDAHSRGKDLGIMNLAVAVPAGLGPLVGALVVTTFGSFSSLYIAAVIVGVLSAAAAIPIRSVR